MFHLILTLISIALAGATALVSVAYVNPVMTLAHDLTDRLEDAFYVLETGYCAYVNANGGTNCQGVVKPSTLSDITPAYAFLPAAPPGMTWSFGSGGTNNEGRWFCLSGQAGPATLRAIVRLQNRLSPQAYFIDAACGSLANNVPQENPGGTTPVGATYWMTLGGTIVGGPGGCKKKKCA